MAYEAALAALAVLMEATKEQPPLQPKQIPQAATGSTYTPTTAKMQPTGQAPQRRMSDFMTNDPMSPAPANMFANIPTGQGTKPPDQGDGSDMWGNVAQAAQAGSDIMSMTGMNQQQQLIPQSPLPPAPGFQYTPTAAQMQQRRLRDIYG